VLFESKIIIILYYTYVMVFASKIIIIMILGNAKIIIIMVFRAKY